MTPTVRAIAFVAHFLLGSAASAQATGEFGRVAARIQSNSSRSTNGRELLRLLVDPSLANPVRASAWSAALTATSGASEAKVQFNLTDVLNMKSLNTSSFALAIIAPLTAGEKLTELANLDGLVGTTRAALSWAREIADDSSNLKVFMTMTGAAPRFEFRTAPSLSESTTRKPTYGINGGAAWINLTWVARAGYRHESNWTAPTEQSVCTPVDIGVPAALTCKALVIGGPTQARKNVVDAEYRRVLRKDFTVGLTVSRNLDNGITGFDLPIWMIPDGEGNLGGGFRLGYRTDTKKPTLSVFVGQFKL